MTPKGGRGVAQQRSSRRESIILADVLRYVRIHPRVAWVRRINTGATKLKGFYVRFGFKGCSDLIGQLIDGRFFAIECKSDAGKMSEEQKDFLARVNRHKGLAGMVRSIEDAEALLNG